MSADLFFWAQPLDNRSPDVMELNGTLLKPTNPADRSLREEYVERIARVQESGRLLVDESNLSARSNKTYFLLKVTPSNLDIAHRKSPILCYGKIPDNPKKDWAENSIKKIWAFAKRIKREINPELLIDTKRALDVIAPTRQASLHDVETPVDVIVPTPKKLPNDTKKLADVVVPTPKKLPNDTEKTADVVIPTSKKLPNDTEKTADVVVPTSKNFPNDIEKPIDVVVPTPKRLPNDTEKPVGVISPTPQPNRVLRIVVGIFTCLFCCFLLVVLITISLFLGIIF